MASNINKAFMRAYAKDRSAATEHAPAVQPSAPITPAPITSAPITSAPMAAAPIAPVAQVAPAQPVVNPIAPPHAVVNQAAVRQPAVHQPAVQQVSTQQPVVRQPMAGPSMANTRRIPAPSVQAPTPAAQPRVITAAPRPDAALPPQPRQQATAQVHPQAQQQPQPLPQPQSMRREMIQESASGEASRVWQRIDAAHATQPAHPTNTQPRPTVSVNATRTAPPRRMQTAAPVAPAPVAPAPTLRVDSAPKPETRVLPLVGDNVVADPQQAEARRRTVADFLYAAGQYNPGRILASASESTDVAHGPMVSSAASTVSMPARSHEPMPMQVDGHGDPVYGLNHAAPATSAPSMPMPTMDEPAIQEPMPRRMGQILRVDVPRNRQAAAPMPESESPAARLTPATNAAAMTAKAAPMEAMPAPAPSTPAPMPTLSSPPVARTTESLEAPVAKYVLEQRRVDRAHKLNAAEEKLRRDTHKIFNPVWEVDTLQWPAVVDKLMHQRAQSMAHVAEHLKTACQDGLSILGVTSANHGEGRTTVACCLARLAAAHGLNVALVDLDLDHPTLCVQTNMEIENDWRDCLSEDISLEEVAVHSIDDQLTVLPLKPRGGRPGLLASDSRIAEILVELSESFELVIVDCSRTNSSGNVITGLAHTKIFDAAIVVVDRRDTQADRVEDAVHMIQQTGIESVGIVDNFSM